MSETQLCSVGVNPVRATSKTGICQANSRCKQAGNYARKQAQVNRERAAGQGQFSCLSCGTVIWPPHHSKATYTCGKAGECAKLARKLGKMLRNLEAA